MRSASMGGETAARARRVGGMRPFTEQLVRYVFLYEHPGRGLSKRDPAMAGERGVATPSGQHTTPAAAPAATTPS